MKKPILLSLAFLLLSACGNTLAGMGKDIDVMGKDISDVFSPSKTNVHAPQPGEQPADKAQ